MGGYTVPAGGGGGAIDPELVKGCTVLGEVIAVYGGWGTEFEPVYGIAGGIVRAATGWGTGRNAAEENTVPGEGVAGYVGWVIGSVYVATGAERAKGGTVRGATEVCGATEGSTVPGGVIAGWVTGAVYGATGVVRSTGDTVCGAAAESECGMVGGIHKPKRSRWRSTAAIAAAVTASTIWLREGAEAASEPCTVLDRSCTVLDIGAREGRRCVTRGLKILGGNDGVSLSVSAAWNITGGTCRRSRSVLRGCGAESLSEPEKVVRLAFPRPLEGSSRRRWPVGAEPSLAEEDSVRLARAISQARKVSRSQRSPGRVSQAASRRSRRRSVAFTTWSLRGVLTLVARAKARPSRHRLPVRSNMVSWTSVAWSLMGTRSSEGNALFLNMNLDTGRSR